jgi:hypothetical protein
MEPPVTVMTGGWCLRRERAGVCLLWRYSINLFFAQTGTPVVPDLH